MLKIFCLFGELPDEGMTEIVFRDVDFLKNVFPSMGDLKRT